MNEKERENRKYISEKIVGRDLTRTRALKFVALSILCGILFGVIAAGVFVFAKGFIEARVEAQAPEETSEQAPPPATPSEGVTEEEPTETSAEIPDLSEPPSAEEETSEGPQEKPLTEENVLLMIREELDHLDLPGEPAEKQEEPSELVRSMQDSVAVIRVTSVEQSWFERNVETYTEYTGLVIGMDEKELLVLSPALSGRDVSYSVIFADGTRKEAQIKSQSDADGISLLSVPAEELGTEFLEKVSVMPCGDLRSVAVGDTVWALGSPLGKARSFGSGLVGYIGEPEQMTDGKVDVFYADVPADADLGTFVADRGGNLIGYASADPAAGSGVRVIGIEWLERVLGALKNGERLPYLGIKGIDVSFDMTYQGIPEGMYIADVAAGSPAYEAGLKRGDIVTGMDGKTISSLEDYSALLMEKKPGSAARLVIRRSIGFEEYRDISISVETGER